MNLAGGTPALGELLLGREGGVGHNVLALVLLGDLLDEGEVRGLSEDSEERLVLVLGALPDGLGNLLNEGVALELNELDELQKVVRWRWGLIAS